MVSRAAHDRAHHEMAKQDVRPANEGLIRYRWVDVAHDGRTIGVGYETHATLDGDWHVYGYFVRGS